MRLLILSQYFDPEPIPKPGDLARELCARGHDVSVVTGLPNYPQGELYDGHRLSLIERHDEDGIQIIRCFEFPYHGQNTLGRIANYLSFMFTAPFGALFAKPADVIYVWHPPLTVGVAAWIIAKVRRIPFVYDVQDIWPESAVLSGILKPGFMVSVLAFIERAVYRWADHLFVVTEGARGNLIGKGVPAEKVSVMPHWIDDEIFDCSDEQVTAARDEHGWTNRFVVLFAGNLGLLQGLESPIRAVADVRDRVKDLLLVFAGDGANADGLRALVKDLGLESNVQFLPPRPFSEMPQLLAAADVLLVHLRKAELSQYVIPTKTLAYLAAGRPILMAMDGAAADLVEEAGAGIVIPPDDIDAIAETLVTLRSMSDEEKYELGRSGREFVNRNLRRRDVISRYERVLHEVAAARDGR